MRRFSRSIHVRWVSHTLAAASVFLVAIAIFNWRLDPFQLFRRDDLYAVGPQYQRYTNLGIIKNAASYDTIVIGSSYLANVRPQQVDELFGGRSVLAVTYGASGIELPTIAAFALRTRPEIKTVFLELFIGSLCSKGVHPSFDFPAGLYAGHWWALVRHLLIRDTSELSLHKALVKLRHREQMPYLSNVAVVHRWYEGLQHVFGDGEYMKKQYAPSTEPDTVLSSDQIETSARTMAGCFEADYLTLARQYPQARFYFINPPMFQWGLRDVQRRDLVRLWNRAHEIVSEGAADLRNVAYFDFNAALDIVNDCRRYMDMGHFDQQSTDALFAWMKEGRFRRTPETNPEYNAVILANSRQLVPCPPLSPAAAAETGLRRRNVAARGQ